MKIDLPPPDLELVLDILARHLPDREVWVFGSRVSGTARPFSDLDMAIIGNEPIPAAVLADVRDDFRESSMPMSVDVIDWATTAEHFRRIIEREHAVLRTAKQNVAT